MLMFWGRYTPHWVVSCVEVVWPSGQKAELEIRWSRVQVPFWSLVGVILDSPEFNSSATLVNSQLVCLLPVGIFNHVSFIVCFIVCFNVCFHRPLKAPFRGWSIMIPDTGFKRWPINSTRGLKVDRCCVKCFSVWLPGFCGVGD